VDVAVDISVRLYGRASGSAARHGKNMKEFWLVIVVTIVGFFGLAALLLVPVWKFLLKEEQVAERWNESVKDHKDGGRSDPEKTDDSAETFVESETVTKGSI
jgi:hypothetical protein